MMRRGCQSDDAAQRPKPRQIRRKDMGFGDLVILFTRNSVYRISRFDDGLYTVAGGWFDQNKRSPAIIEITGCTWGGSVIKTDIMAARGRHLQFGNGVVTSPIRKIYHLKAAERRVLSPEKGQASRPAADVSTSDSLHR